MAFSSPGPVGLSAALGLHVVFFAWAGLFVRPAPLPDTEEQVVLVELVAAPDVTIATQAGESPGPGAPVASEAVVSAPEDTASPEKTTSLIAATRLMAGSVFADPRNAEARAMLELIVPSVRREQVCGVEAMEQIKLETPQRRPECVIAYAYDDAQIDGDQVTARGAAVLIGTIWFRLEYECVLGVDLVSVKTFRYRIGDVISQEEVERLELATCQ